MNGLFCKECGHHLSKDSAFCPYCGTDLRSVGFVSVLEENKEDSGTEKNRGIGTIILSLCIIIPIYSLLAFSLRVAEATGPIIALMWIILVDVLVLFGDYELISGISELTDAPSHPLAIKNRKAIASLVLGIISLFSFILPPIIVIPLAITGIVMGSKGHNSEKTGLAIAGMVTSIIGLVISVISFIVTTFISFGVVALILSMF